ncbi:MAG: hypothetical protein H7343_02160 [Undibacterium sp.]|nr:hypothetical protein [Opitutaceae bacterium]
MTTCLPFRIAVVLGALTSVLTAEVMDAAATARATLRRVLVEETGWVKVHAAEVLNAYGAGDEVRKVFLEEGRQHGTETPYRIGIWRVLAVADERGDWAARIEAVFLDEKAPDRLHALESLGKLHCAVHGETLAALHRWRGAAGPGEAVFGDWVRASAGEPGARDKISAALAGAEPVTRLRAAHILRVSSDVTATEKARVAAAAGAEPRETAGYVYVLGAAYALNADPAQMTTWRGELERIIRTGTPGAAHAAWQGLLGRVTVAEINQLAPGWAQAKGDAAIGAAWAVLAASGPGGVRR